MYEVVWPLGRSSSKPAIKPSSPVLDLTGKTVAEVWTFAFKGDQMFQIIREKLRERFPEVKFIDYHTFGNIHGSREAEVIASLPEMLRRHGCDAVITAVGA